MNTLPKAYIDEVIESLRKGRMSKEQLAKLKIALCTKHGVRKIPTDIEILINADKTQASFLKRAIQTKPVRTISGVAPVAIMTSPEWCPHGRCTFCPGGIDSHFGDVPQSYTGREPATMRGIRAGFDPYIQVFNRLEQYVVTGHEPDKVELILMGGTFTARDKEYQEEFVKFALKAMNDFSKQFYKEGELDVDAFKEFFELPGEVGDPERTKWVHVRIKELKGDTKLEDAQKENERSKIRCIGMTIETKPDWALLEQGNEMLRLGATRVELGVQTTEDLPLQLTKRGHTTKESIESIRVLRDLGFKLNFHIMLGMPGVKNDLKALKKLFDDPDYRPDMLKLYPCMVMPGTPLQKDYQEGRYTPLSTEEAALLIADFKPSVPEYCRIMRVQRDIPSERVEAGVMRTNLRQYIQKHNPKCRCIRCREAGRKRVEKVDIVIRDYDASQGKEHFISAEDLKNDALLGFVRMRFPSQSLREEITEDSAIIRELHVYGQAIAIGENDDESVQHKGYGRKLMERAEAIAKDSGKRKMVVISGIGVREYYENLGYKREGPYMVKELAH